MKKTLLTLLVLSSSLFGVKAQTNLVLNPSFEIYDTCPKNQNEISYAVGWHNFSQTPDYFNSCSINWQFSVPYNEGGYQIAASGVAYGGFCGYLSPYFHIPNYRELIGGTLSSSLIIGTKYYVAFMVSLSISDTLESNCAINNLGATFSTIRSYGSTLINNAPKIHEDSLIKDTGAWIRVFGSFIADSAYKYIIVGNLFDDAHTDTIILDSTEYFVYKNCEAYYYLDNVCVSTDSLYTLDYIYTGTPIINEFPLFDIYPNPANQKLTLNFKGQINGFASLSIIDITGRELIQRFSIDSDGIMQIDIASLASGMYFINIKDNKGTFMTQKFIKQ